jgi:hypothetical protein
LDRAAFQASENPRKIPRKSPAPVAGGGDGDPPSLKLRRARKTILSETGALTLTTSDDIHCIFRTGIVLIQLVKAKKQQKMTT